MYLEGVNRALAELRETEHHLTIALKKSYLTKGRFDNLKQRYEECGRMLRGLEQSLEKYRL